MPFTAPGPTLTYGELDLRARAIAHRLQSLDGTGERVILLFEPGLAFIEAFFGCLYAGAIAVPAPVPRKRSLPRLALIARDARAAFVLTASPLQEQLAPVASELGVRHWLSTSELPPEAAERWKEPRLGGDSLAFLQYTSGSTGDPRGGDGQSRQPPPQL